MTASRPSRARIWLVLVAAAALCALALPRGQAPAGARAIRVQLLHSALGLYVFYNGGANTLVYDRDDGLVVVDPKTAGSGPLILKNIESITDRTVTTVIATSTRPDHAGAIGEFPDATRIVVHESTATRLKTDAIRGAQTVAVKDHVSLFPNAPQVEVYYFGKGHSDGDLVVVFPQSGVVHLGDLFPAKAAPVIDVANGGSGVAFPETLARLLAEVKGVRRVSPGHYVGNVPPKSVTGDLMSWTDLEDYEEFNRVFLQKVRDAIAAGLTAQQAAAQLQMPDKFRNYDMKEAPANVAAIYRELGK